MRLNDISKPKTADNLNENLAKRFGQKINIEQFTLEQLQDVRNKIRTKMSQFESKEKYESVLKDSEYQKNKLFLDVLNQAIAEREDIADQETTEASKPDFPDVDGDGNTKEPISKAAKDKKEKGGGDKKKKDLSKVPPQLRKHMKGENVDEGKQIIENYFVHVAKLFEGEEDKAEIVMAAKDMVNRVTGWMEDTAEMQAESMLELGDAIRDEMGNVQSEQFIQTVKPALESLYGSLESTRGALTSGVAQLTGEEDPAQAMGDEMPAEEPAPEGDAPAPEIEDDFAAAEPAAGGEEEAGREKRESIERSIRLGRILSSKKK